MDPKRHFPKTPRRQRAIGRSLRRALMLAIAPTLLAATTQPAPQGPTIAAAAKPASTPPATSNYVKQAITDFDLTPELLSGAPSPGDDPLKAMEEKMAVIRDDLGHLQTDQPVQDKQKKVVDSLNALIAALEQHGGTGMGNKPIGGRKQSIIVTADPNNGPLHGVEQQGRQWGQLPAKQRQEILQSRTEGFPPGYESLLQNYYQQLAQEKPTDDKTTPPPAPTATTAP